MSGRLGQRAWGSFGVAALVAATAVVLRRMSPSDPGRYGARDVPGNARHEPDLLRRVADWVPPPPVTRRGRAAAYAWAAPVSTAGLLVGAVAGCRPQPRDGVLVFAGARGPVGAMLRRRGFAATTLGHVVITTDAFPSAELLAHELVHTRQAERWGVAFGPAYVALLARYGYREHPFERAARAGTGR